MVSPKILDHGVGVTVDRFGAGVVDFRLAQCCMAGDGAAFEGFFEDALIFDWLRGFAGTLRRALHLLNLFFSVAVVLATTTVQMDGDLAEMGDLGLVRIGEFCVGYSLGQQGESVYNSGWFDTVVSSAANMKFLEVVSPSVVLRVPRISLLRPWRETRLSSMVCERLRLPFR